MISSTAKPKPCGLARGHLCASSSEKMKQTVCIECKSFDLVEEYVGNSKVLKIIERRKAFSLFIKFKVALVPWFCGILEQAGRAEYIS